MLGLKAELPAIQFWIGAIRATINTSSIKEKVNGFGWKIMTVHTFSAFHFDQKRKEIVNINHLTSKLEEVMKKMELKVLNTQIFQFVIETK